MFQFLERVLVLGLHIPDGFLSLPVSGLFWLATVAALALAVRRSQRALDDRQVPLMGVLAACIFAAQMLNFPVAGGTSGHLLGGALAAIVLGPGSGMLVMSCVVALQALLFQDGGLVVMGSNIFNMGILTALLGSLAFTALFRLFGGSRRALGVAAFGAAWLSVVASSFLTALQLIASGTAQADVVITAMVAVHALIGVGEGLISAAALSFLMSTRPDLLPAHIQQSLSVPPRPLRSRALLAAGAIVAAILVGFSPLASGAPDGLERVAIDLGFVDGERGPVVVPATGVLAEYAVPGMGGGISTILAGLIGIAIVLMLGYGIALLLRRKRGARAAAKRVTA